MSLQAAESVRQDDLNADKDQDDATENRGFSGQLRAEFSPQDEPARTDGKGYGSDDQGRYQSLNKGIVRDGKADGQCVNRGGNALQHQRAEADGRLFVTVIAPDPFEDHLSAEKNQEDKCNPRNITGKGLKYGKKGMDEDPAGQRHERLKAAEGAGDQPHSSAVHLRFVQAVGKRYGKSVHCETDTEQNTVDEPDCFLHTFTFTFRNKIQAA